MARGQKVVIMDVPLNKIKLGRNSRLAMNNEDLSGLMQSINSTGLLEPIGVIKSKKSPGQYDIAYGNRRFMAFSRLGLHSIPAVIHEFKNESDIDVKNLAENVQRRNISLAEIGRYASILEGEGLKNKELAVRLGVNVGYIESALKAYKEVPVEYREHLEVKTTGKASEPGKLPIYTARAIINTKKSLSLSKGQEKQLYEAALKDKRFSVENVTKYGIAIKHGKKDPIGTVKPVKTFTFRMAMYEEDYDRIMSKHIDDGPFNSFTALIRAVLRGQKQVMINTID